MTNACEEGNVMLAIFGRGPALRSWRETSMMSPISRGPSTAPTRFRARFSAARDQERPRVMARAAADARLKYALWSTPDDARICIPLSHGSTRPTKKE